MCHIIAKQDIFKMCWSPSRCVHPFMFYWNHSKSRMLLGQFILATAINSVSLDVSVILW